MLTLAKNVATGLFSEITSLIPGIGAGSSSGDLLPPCTPPSIWLFIGPAAGVMVFILVISVLCCTGSCRKGKSDQAGVKDLALKHADKLMALGGIGTSKLKLAQSLF